jgi:hypothetical protein
MIGKKSFVLYSDLKALLDKLPDVEAGKLFKTILDYVNDLNPEPEELIVQVAFEPIKQQLKRDLNKWDEIKGKRSKAGKMSAAKKALLLTSVESVEQDETKSTVNENVNVNDNVNWNKLIEIFNLTFSKNSKVIGQSTRKKYHARLKEGYTKNDIIEAMKNAKKDSYHKETDFKYCTLEFFSRADKIDRFINQKESKYIATK